MAGSEVTHEQRLASATSATVLRQDSTTARRFYDAQILITELTFVAPRHRKDKIDKFGHMHLDDLLERRRHGFATS